MPIGAPTQRFTSAGARAATYAFSPATTMAAGTLGILTTSRGNNTKVVSSVADSVGNTWTVDAAVAKAASLSASEIVSAQIVNPITSSDTITITYSSATSVWDLVQLQELTGMATSLAFDKSAGNGAATGTTIDSGATATLAQADEFVICAIYITAAVGWTEGATYTRRTSADNNSGGIEYKTVAATTAVNGTGTVGSSSYWLALVATYKGAVAAETLYPDTEWLSFI